MKLYQIAIIHIVNEFQLCSSLCKSKYKEQIFPIGAHQLTNEDLQEKKDPDFIPDDDDDDLD